MRASLDRGAVVRVPRPVDYLPIRVSTTVQVSSVLPHAMVIVCWPAFQVPLQGLRVAVPS